MLLICRYQAAVPKFCCPRCTETFRNPKFPEPRPAPHQLRTGNLHAPPVRRLIATGGNQKASVRGDLQDLDLGEFKSFKLEQELQASEISLVYDSAEKVEIHRDVL